MTTNASLSRRFDSALAILRVIAGSIFIAHGAQKLFVFGFAGVSGAFGQMGIPLPGLMGPFIALLEFFGGIALVIGLLTRLASLGLTFNMLGAIAMVHLKAGFFNPAGIEFPLALVGMNLALVFAGAGGFSLDAVIATRRAKVVRTATPQLQRQAA